MVIHLLPFLSWRDAWFVLDWMPQCRGSTYLILVYHLFRGYSSLSILFHIQRRYAKHPVQLTVCPVGDKVQVQNWRQLLQLFPHRPSVSLDSLAIFLWFFPHFHFGWMAFGTCHYRLVLNFNFTGPSVFFNLAHTSLSYFWGFYACLLIHQQPFIRQSFIVFFSFTRT